MAKDRTIVVPGGVAHEYGKFSAAEPRPRRKNGAGGAWPEWARWNRLGRRYTIGVEEELMLLDRSDHSLAQSSDRVLGRLSDALSKHSTPETHASVIELATGVHVDVAGAVAELAALRAQLARELYPMGLCAASAGMYPLACSTETQVSGSARYRMIADSMRTLARREPTLAVHVHVGVPDPEDAVRVLNALRGAVPELLALSANSPFCQGRDSGFASTRTVIFQGFPRTGTARWFAGYADYVRALDALIGSGALQDPSFLWWDVRLQPVLGTVEVRVMDAQSTIADTAPLIALVQSLSRLELESESMEGESMEGVPGPEVLAENRFLAARDGLEARLIDSVRCRRAPVRKRIKELLAKSAPHAGALGCSVELDRVKTHAQANGADRQRAWVAEAGLANLIATLSDRFAAPSGRPGEPAELRRLAKERVP